MLVNLTKENSKKAKNFIKKSERDGLTEVIIRLQNDRSIIKIETSKFSGNERREIKIDFETGRESTRFNELVFDLTTNMSAVDYLLSEQILLEVYKNNLKNIHFEDDNGNVKDTRYFIDTVCIYKMNKNMRKEKMIKIDRIGFDEIRMIK